MEKTVITAEEFEKKVEIELEYLVYMDRLNRTEAREKAKKVIGEKFEVKGK